MSNFKLNILIAEDDKDDAEMLIEALRSVLPSGNCIVTKNGIECLRYLKTHDAPDLVFLDLNMPLKNGISTHGDIYNEDLYRRRRLQFILPLQI